MAATAEKTRKRKTRQTTEEKPVKRPETEEGLQTEMDPEEALESSNTGACEGSDDSREPIVIEDDSPDAENEPLTLEDAEDLCEVECAEMCDGPETPAGSHGYGHRPRRNVWFPDYEEPMKPLSEFTAREVGMEGECLAARHLHRHDFEILEQNWRTKCGEVDIIARDPSGEIVLVEVKTRLILGGDRHAMPELAVDAKKQMTYRRLALLYLMCHPEVDSLRFDVMAVNIVGEHTARLRHLVGAFEWDA